MPNYDLFFIESLNQLYTDVQLNSIFADSKFFVDCVPKFSVENILTSYSNLKNNADFKLLEFVKENFIYPSQNESTYSSAKKTIEQHLNELWQELKRNPDQNKGTLIPLPYPYIVPGGRFREIYYWDSYFTMLGLQVSNQVDVIENMVDNFAYLINQFGFIPNGNRTYYLGRSQPPFFALMLSVLAEEKGVSFCQKYLPALENEYAFWINGADNLSVDNNATSHVVLLEDNFILNRYWDKNTTPRPEAYIEDEHIASEADITEEIMYRHIRAAAESGWDFSSRWFKDKNSMATICTTDILPVDLNCLLLFVEETLLKIYTRNNNESLIKAFKTNIDNRKIAIQKYCWNETEGCFFDYDFISKNQIVHFNLATVFPLFFNIASVSQAKKIADLLSNKFLFTGGLITTIYKTGQQWDAPNGWAPLQWMAYKGLKNYGYIDLANQIKNNWLGNCEKVFNETGKMMEKYNVMDTTVGAGGGEYPNQDGFGWTNGVYLKMKADI